MEISQFWAYFPSCYNKTSGVRDIQAVLSLLPWNNDGFSQNLKIKIQDTFFYEKGNENNQPGTRFLTPQNSINS